MTKTIEELCKQLKRCPLSDNKVDEVEKELLLESQYKSWGHMIRSVLTSMEDLIKKSISLGDLSQPELPDYKVKEMNDWDHLYDNLCDSTIERAKRFYKQYCEIYKAWNREPKSFEGYMAIEDAEEWDHAVSQEEIEVLKDEFALRWRYGLKCKNVYYPPMPSIKVVDGIEARPSVGQFYVNYESEADDEYGFPETSIPYLIPLEATSAELKGGKILLLDYWKTLNPRKMPGRIDTWKRGEASFIRIWTLDERNFEDISYKSLPVTPRGREFALKNHIDINGLISRGLALDATKEDGIYD